MEQSTIRVLVVDDHEPFRKFIVTTLKTKPHLRIVQEACDGAEAVQQAQELQPDLILLDIGLPTLSGIEAALQIREVSPSSKILFVSENRSADIAEAAFDTGAGGYVVKSDAAAELLSAVEAVLQGGQFVSASLAAIGIHIPGAGEIIHPRKEVLTSTPQRGVETVRRVKHNVAAAANLKFAMQEIAAQFRAQTEMEVNLVYGSSGNLSRELQNGTPFDMFFSANLDYPKELETSGLIECGSYYEYAKGKIVVWVSKESALDVSSGLQALLSPWIKKIAVANPQYAPYGRAAVAAMRKEGIYDRVKNKFVLAENISDTASLIVSGAADVGVVALSLAVSPSMKSKGHYFEIPTTSYPPIEQACVILKSSKQKDTAKAFLNFIKSPTVDELFRNYGFAVPGSSTAQ